LAATTVAVIDYPSDHSLCCHAGIDSRADTTCNGRTIGEMPIDCDDVGCRVGSKLCGQ
jgi:hypothetical protein